jgi:hypothetical protein
VNRYLRSYFFTFLFVSEPEKCAAVNINDGLYVKFGMFAYKSLLKKIDNSSKFCMTQLSTLKSKIKMKDLIRGIQDSDEFFLNSYIAAVLIEKVNKYRSQQNFTEQLKLF